MAIDLQHAKVEDAAIFRPTELKGNIWLAFAKVGAWYDEPDAWPENGRLKRFRNWLTRCGSRIADVVWGPRPEANPPDDEPRVSLKGFTYNAIEPERSIGVRERLKWLRRDDEGFVPQPYEQLAKVYRSEGDERRARMVQISAQWRRRISLTPRRDISWWPPSMAWSDIACWPIRVCWSMLLWATIGYGYRPWRILVPIGVLFGFGTWWFDRAAKHCTTVHDITQCGIVRAKIADEHACFHGARYTADLLIPGASLGERTRFIATGATAWWAAGYTLAGWALAAMLIAGLTGVFKRERN